MNNESPLIGMRLTNSKAQRGDYKSNVQRRT
jgi:hypothetical protein